MAFLLTGAAHLTQGVYSFFVSVLQAVNIYISSDEKLSEKHNTPKGIGLSRNAPLPDNLPTAVDIKKAIPKHCFHPRVSTSMYFVIKDFLLVCITYFSFRYVQDKIDNPLLYSASMLLYYAIQGTLFFALFVIGHDCGHGSFSAYPLLNDTMGTLTNGFLMAPYYMWKLSHRRHHQHTSNIDKDEVYYPVRKSDAGSEGKVVPLFGFGVGWFGYLAFGYRPRAVNHYNPKHTMFRNHVLACVISLMAEGAMAYVLYEYTKAHGLPALFHYYLVPLFIFASYMVVITFLHHHEENIPWYGDERWDFVRGQLSSVDRHYGIVHDVIHNIGTHQIHHLFAKIPHYHLEEATVHFRKTFPELVRVSEEPILPSFFRMFKKYERQCVIDDDKKVHVYE